MGAQNILMRLQMVRTSQYPICKGHKTIESRLIISHDETQPHLGPGSATKCVV